MTEVRSEADKASSVPVLDLLGSDVSNSHQGLGLGVCIWVAEHVANAALSLKDEVELVTIGVNSSRSRTASKSISVCSMFIRLLPQFQQHACVFHCLSSILVVQPQGKAGQLSSLDAKDELILLRWMTFQNRLEELGLLVALNNLGSEFSLGARGLQLHNGWFSGLLF